MGPGEFRRFFQMFINGSLSAVIITDFFIQEIRNSFLLNQMPDGQYCPQMIVRMDGRNRLISLYREKIVVNMTILILLSQQKTDFFPCHFRIKRDHGKNILRGIPIADSPESPGGIIGNIPGEQEVPLRLIGIPAVHHSGSLLIRELSLKMGQIFFPAVS